MYEIKLLSIVIPYYNRKQLLINTLKSINYFKSEYPIEIIIVDDGSNNEHQVNDISTLFPDLNINLIILSRDTSKWRGAAIAYNTGFDAATGDVILINSADTIHMGDIIGYIFKFLTEKSYISFSTYQGTPEMLGGFNNFNWEIPDVTKRLIDIGLPYSNWWNSHSTNYTLIPYCGALTTENMRTLGGYDERFIKGIGYDDYDFIDRVKNLGLKTELIDDPFCVHQHHKATVYSNTINLDFLVGYLRKQFPNRIKAERL
jgi:glycosyltransferase involved in cell wall biosynthesis